MAGEPELLSIEESRKKSFTTEWEKVSLPVPNKYGIQVIEDIDLGKIVEYFDWTPFSYLGIKRLLSENPRA